MPDENTAPRRRRTTVPDSLPERPRRRREDEDVEQLLELIRVQADVIDDLTLRIGRAERILMEIADVHFESMNPEEKGAFKPLAKEWVRNEGTVERSDLRTERWVRWATVFSGITAGGISIYGIAQIAHALLTSSTPPVIP